MQRFRWIALQGSSRGYLPPLLLFYFITTSGIPAHAADDPTACRVPVARVVSIQGSIEVLRARHNDWSRVTRLDTPLCEGDELRTGMLSRAALFIQPETLVRVDQNTNISVSQTTQETLVEFIQQEVLPAAAGAYTCGAGYFITRFPRTFRVKTPHLNAAVEGTEFLVAMRCASTELSVFEGKVLAAGAGASVFPAQSISSGQVLTIGGSEPPAIKLLVKPTDAVQWVVYYPPLSDATAEADLPAAEQCRSLPKPLDQACLTQRAETLLRLGRVAEAQREVDEAVALDSGSGDANALRAIISIARNDKAAAIEAATAATTASPNSSRAWLALSYAQQASFKLEDSLSSARKAQALEPNSSVTNTRVAELLMSLGRIKDAEKAARAAVEANPSESRAHTVLGFVRLALIRTKEARADFLNAIERDSSDPLPRLGLGLAIIRTGKLAEGREQLEIAVALDPTNSLLRSYVGKAYYEENTKDRDQLASGQFALAKQLDPKDPTPWFYDAILKQGQNRSVEALMDLQESVELNDNRAVDRSRLLLDQDFAARSADLARVYSDIGMPEPALALASQSLSVDPASPTAHRFLADTYASLPRHEVARASELLQSQLRQPRSSVPLQAQLANDQLSFLYRGAGPTTLGLTEFNPLFDRNRGALEADVLAGDNDTLGHQLIVGGMVDNASVALSHFRFDTNGFRTNNDNRRETYDAYFGVQVDDRTGFQAEITQASELFGDLMLRFDPARFDPVVRNTSELDQFRIGAWHQPTPNSEVLLSYISQDRSAEALFPPTDVLSVDTESTKIEAQYGLKFGNLAFVTGVSDFRGQVTEDIFGLLVFDSTPKHVNAYSYGFLDFPYANLSLQIGVGYDHLRSRDSGDQSATHPKFGMIWKPLPATTVRVAAFGVLKRRIAEDQGLEPSQLAGFNQYFDDANGTESKRAGIGIDQKLGRSVFIGAEGSARDLSVPSTNLDGTIDFIDWDETIGQAYAHWIATDHVVWSLAARYENFDRDPNLRGPEDFIRVKNTLIPLSLQLVGFGGFSGSVTVSHFRQTGQFVDSALQFFDGEETSVLTDMSLRYRLPKRMGSIALEGRNIFDKEFNFQTTDLTSVRFAPNATFFLRLNLRF